MRARLREPGVPVQPCRGMPMSGGAAAWVDSATRGESYVVEVPMGTTQWESSYHTD